MPSAQVPVIKRSHAPHCARAGEYPPDFLPRRGPRGVLSLGQPPEALGRLIEATGHERVVGVQVPVLPRQLHHALVVLEHGDGPRMLTLLLQGSDELAEHRPVVRRQLQRPCERPDRQLADPVPQRYQGLLIGRCRITLPRQAALGSRVYAPPAIGRRGAERGSRGGGDAAPIARASARHEAERDRLLSSAMLIRLAQIGPFPWLRSEVCWQHRDFCTTTGFPAPEPPRKAGDRDLWPGYPPLGVHCASVAWMWHPQASAGIGKEEPWTRATLCRCEPGWTSR